MGRHVSSARNRHSLSSWSHPSGLGTYGAPVSHDDTGAIAEPGSKRPLPHGSMQGAEVTDAVQRVSSARSGVVGGSNTAPGADASALTAIWHKPAGSAVSLVSNSQTYVTEHIVGCVPGAQPSASNHTVP